MNCPFCNEEVEEEIESVQGCKKCVEDWLDNMHVDHEVD